jgi:Fur family ferric uptake transcriptional regulator
VAVAAIDPDGVLSRALRAAGLRVTMPRLIMLAWLEAHPHSTAEAVGAGLREQFGAVSTQAVYDMLAACTTTGLLRRIEPAGHPARFERRVGDDHHHVVCRRCDRTEDVDGLAGAQPCLTPVQAMGFSVDEAEVVFWGICPRCEAAGRSPDGEERDEEVWQ